MAESDAEARAKCLNLESALAAYQVKNSRMLNASSGEISMQQQPAFDNSFFLSVINDCPLPSSSRKPNFSEEDKFYLIEQFEKNRHILEAKYIDRQSNHNKRVVWQAIAEGLNERNPRTTRTTTDVRKKWKNLLSEAKKAYAEFRRLVENGLNPPSLDPVIERIFAMYGGATPIGTSADRLGEAIDAAAFLEESAYGQMDGNESKSAHGYLETQMKAAAYDRNILRNDDKTADVEFQSSGCNSNDSAEVASSTDANVSKRIKLEVLPRSVEDAAGAIETCFSVASPLQANSTHTSAYYQNEQLPVMAARPPNLLYSQQLNRFPHLAHQPQRHNQITNQFPQQPGQSPTAADVLPLNGVSEKSDSAKPSSDSQSLQLECLQLKKQNLIMEQERISLEKQKLSAEIAKINSEKEKLDLEIAFMKKRLHQDS